MSGPVTILIDGVEVSVRPGQTILSAADEAGIYIPRLCHLPGLAPFGSCRVCTVTANGRPCASCTTPVTPGMIVENDTERLREMRRQIVEMLFSEGNHFCMFCEKSGNCELQAMAYRLGIPASRYPGIWPVRDVDSTHPDILIDRNRCILCGRCVRASRDVDGKQIFGFVGRGHTKRIAVLGDAKLRDSGVDVTDAAIDVCPVGALLRKGTAFRVPIGQRRFDKEPIGADIEARKEKP
jgi:[NiFe] hydrogenase diaphorase moiety small subunit